VKLSRPGWPGRLAVRPGRPAGRSAGEVADAGGGQVVAQAGQGRRRGPRARRLPEQQRTTLAMAAAGGLTSAEIATALGVPAGTVRYRLSLARRALAAALASYDHPANQEAR